MSEATVIPPGGGEVVGDAPDRRVEILCEHDALHATWTRFGPRRDGADLHIHHRHTDLFYVLEGELTVYTPGEELTLRPGDYLLAPRGVPHTYRVGERPARWLVTSIPAGFERFVAAVSELAEPDPGQLGRVAAEHGIDILGPPGALP